MLLGACNSEANDKNESLDSVMDTAQVGDCFVSQGKEVKPVECTQTHDSELFAREAHDTTDVYPGDVELETTSFAMCKKALVAQYPDAAENDGLTIQVANPTKEAWNAGQHEYLCFAEWNNNQTQPLSEIFTQ